MSKGKGPEFIKYCVPIIAILKELGGTGKPSEITDAVIERLRIPESEQEETTTNGQSRVRNQIAWARFYLVKLGHMDSPQRGIWGLTESGRKSDLRHDDFVAMFRTMPRPVKSKKLDLENEPLSDGPEVNEDEQEFGSDHRSALITVLRSLTPDGFERICQLLLRESGFERVVVTGRSGDGGIDGHGVLQINPFVSFKVLFQCKRYQGSVPVSTVRDFRGALQGRADKGIIITTGSFTTDAKNEAIRDGAPPIELVDGDELVKLFEMYELGLKPTTGYVVDSAFFDRFR
jgi:restriction system protein